MSRRPPKNNKNLDKFIEKTRQTRRSQSTRAPQQEHPVNAKSPKAKRIVNLHQLFKKTEQTAEGKKQEKVSLQKCLAESHISEILTNCKQLDKWVKGVLENNPKLKDRLLLVFQRHLQVIPNSLWSDKYQPKSLAELFDEKIASRISQWIKAYTKYRVNDVGEQSNSFIDDFDYNQEGSSSVLMLIHQNNWKCRALVLKGRPNTGRTSLIRVISRQLNYAIHECAVDRDQQRYLKENNESTKSENISCLPRNQKIDRTNHNINRYFPNLNQTKSEKPQRNALQFIRDFDCVYPQGNRDKFFRFLNTSIDSSKVPFILSTSSSTLPCDYAKHDAMELEEPSFEKLADFFWLVYLVEKTFSLKLDRSVLIKQEDVWVQLNQQLTEQIPIDIDVSRRKIKNVVKMFHGNLSAIYNFLQFHQVQHLYREASFFTQRITSEDLLYGAYDKQFYISKTRQDLESKDTKFLEATQPEHEKRQPEDFREMSKALKMRRTARSVGEEFMDDFRYQKLFDHNIQVEQSLLHNIPVDEHMKAKKDICKAFMNHQERKLFSDENHQSSLRRKELGYLPMIAIVRKSRKAQITFQETLNKFLSQKKVRYLLQFTDMTL